MKARGRKRRLKIKNMKRFLIFAALLGFFLFSLAGNVVKAYQLHKEMLEVERQVQDLTEKNKELREKIKMLQSDEYVEKMAREKLGLVKPGEKVIIRAQKGEAPKPAADSSLPAGE